MSIVLEKGRWNLHETSGKKRWATEMSDLKANAHERNCPACGHPIQFGNKPSCLRPVRDAEGELVHWIGKCLCGVELIVFND